MPVAAISDNTRGTANRAYSLTVSGVNLLESAPVNIYPITWDDEKGNSVGAMTVTFHDPEPLWANRNKLLRIGAEVEFRDATLPGEPLFAGPIVNIDYERAIKGRWVTVTVYSPDAWLDWCIIPRYDQKANWTRGNRRITNDRGIVKEIVDGRWGPITTYGGFVESTNTNMPLLKLRGMTYREALEEIGEQARDGDPNISLPRSFYVDYNYRLHYYEGEESNPAPFRVTDAEYAALVTQHANIREYWPMTEADPTVDYVGRMGVKDLDITLGTPTNGEQLVVNQPGSAKRGDSSTILVSVPSGENAGAALTASGGFAVEYWLKDTDGFSNTPYFPLCFGGTADPEVRLNPAYIQLRNRGDGTYSRWTYTFSANTLYHVVIGKDSGGTDYCYVNGVDQGARDAGGGCSTFGDDWTSMTVLRNSFGLIGDTGHWAWYTGDGLTAAEVLDHYNAGRAITVENHRRFIDGEDRVTRVYVKGKNRRGSGWVASPTGQRFDKGHPADFVERKWSDTRAKKNRAGRSVINKRRNITGGSFSLDENTAGWRAGQIVNITDSAFGQSENTYIIQSVRGTFDERGPHIEIDYGNVRRKFLREYRRNVRRGSRR